MKNRLLIISIIAILGMNNADGTDRILHSFSTQCGNNNNNNQASTQSNNTNRGQQNTNRSDSSVQTASESEETQAIIDKIFDNLDFKYSILFKAKGCSDNLDLEASDVAFLVKHNLILNLGGTTKTVKIMRNSKDVTDKYCFVGPVQVQNDKTFYIQLQKKEFRHGSSWTTSQQKQTTGSVKSISELHDFSLLKKIFNNLNHDYVLKVIDENDELTSIGKELFKHQIIRIFPKKDFPGRFDSFSVLDWKTDLYGKSWYELYEDDGKYIKKRGLKPNAGPTVYKITKTGKDEYLMSEKIIIPDNCDIPQIIKSVEDLKDNLDSPEKDTHN